MTYYVNLPNGNRIPFEDDVPEDVAKYRALHNYFSPPAAPTELPSEAPSAPAAGGGLGDWFPVTSALHRTGAELASAAEGVGRMTGLKGLEEYARSVQESQSKAAEEALPESRRVRFENISGPVSAAQFGTQAATESALPMAAAIAGGSYGASLGSAFGPPGALVGGLGGAIIGGGLAMLPTTYGSMRESQIAQAQRVREAQGLPTPKREEIEVNEGAALAAAVPVAIAQAAANRITFGLGRAVGLSMEEVGTTLLPRIARGAGVGAVDQIPVGVLQTALDRAQTGRDLFSEDALEEYKKMTAESAAIGAMFGGAHRGLFGKRPGPRESGFDPDLRRAITEDLAERNRIRGENFPDFIDTPVGRMPFSAADDFFTKRYHGLGDIPETERRVNAGNLIFADEVTVNSNNIKAAEAEISGYNDIIKQNTDAKNDLIKKSKSPKGTRVSKDVLDFYDAKIKDAQDAIKDVEDRIRQLKKATPELPQSLRKAVDAPEPFFKPEMIQGALDALDQRTKPPEVSTAPPEVPPPVEPTVKAGAAPEAPTSPKASPEATTVPQGTPAGTWRPTSSDEIHPPGRLFRMNMTTGQQEVFEPANPQTARTAERLSKSFNNTPEGQALLAEVISARQANDPAREAAAMERYSKALAEFERGEIGEAARQPREWSAESEFSGRAEEPAKAAEETKPEAPKEEPPKATPQDESAAAKARKIIDDHLKKISDTGKQGENIAAGLRKLLDEEWVSPAQAYAAFRIGEQLNRQLPAGSDHIIEFVKRLSTSGGTDAAIKASGLTKESSIAGARVAPKAVGDQIERGIIRLSLEQNKLSIIHDTAAHEAFHVIQDYIAKFDPKLAKMLNADFRDGMKLSDVDKSLRRKLELSKNPNGRSYWSALTADLKDKSLSAREMQAVVFAALSDAHGRGTPMTGIKPGYTRFVNMISQFFQRMGNALRGDGFKTVGDVFDRINRGEAARRFATEAAPVKQAPAETAPPKAQEAPKTEAARQQAKAPEAWAGEAARPQRGEEWRGEAEFSPRLGQTESPEFRRWFGNSKTVDENGKPIVFYHGTSKDADFDKFNVGKRGSWFTNDPLSASRYSEENDSQKIVYENGRYTRKNEASRVVPAYLKIEKPYTGEYPENYKYASNYAKAQREFFDELKSKGYDGWIMNNGEVAVVFNSPAQIKSAIGNVGTFDESNPRIQYSPRGQEEKLSKIKSIKSDFTAKDQGLIKPQDRKLANSLQENLNKSASGVEFSPRGSDDIINYRLADWNHVEFPEDWGVGKNGVAFYYKGTFAHGGNLNVDAYVSSSRPDTIWVGTAATSGVERNPFASRSRTQIEDKEIENRVNVGARQTLQAMERMARDIAEVFPDVKRMEFIRGTGARGIFPEGKEGVIPLPERWLPEKRWTGEAERPSKLYNAEAEFSPRQGDEYAPRTAAPAGAGASFVEKVQGIDPIKQSVFGRALAAFTGAKKLTYIYGEPSAEKNWDALVRSSVNLAHPFYIYDDLLRSQGIWNGRNAGRAVEEAFVHGGRIQSLLEDGMLQIDPRTKEVSIVPGSEPLLKIIGNDVSASDIKEQRDFGAYLIGLRERDLRADGRQGFHNVTDAEIANHIREMEAAHPEWRRVADKLQNFNKGLLKFATESGVIDRAQAAHLESMFYTPFYRLMESDVNAAPERALGPRMQNALQDPRSWMRELKGGESAVGDVFKNIILNADSIIKSGMKNMAMQTATEIMEIGGVARKVPEGVSFGRNENVVSFRVDGKNVQYHVADPVLWAAIGGMPATQRGALANVAAKFAHFFRESVTMAPSFMLSNIWRGKIIAYAQGGAPLIRGTAASLKDAFQHGASSQAIAAGSGFGGYTWGMGERDIAKNFARRLRMQSGEGTISDRIVTALKGMQRLSESTEMMERVNIYNAAIKQGMSHGDAAWKAYQLAPFSRRGTGDGFFGSMVRSALPYIPFLNARLQGLYRLVEANPGSARVLGIPKEIFLRSLMVMAFSTAAAGYAMVNDPDGWAGLTVDQKMNYHNIPIGDGKMIGIPREFEVGTFFGGLPVMMMDQLFRQGAAGKDMAKALGAAISTTFGFTPIPTIAQPLISTIANYDFFRQAPLENKQQQQLPVAERRNLRTTETAKAISAGATALGSYVKELPIIGSLSALSPIKAQALLEGYLGTLGTIALTGFDQTMSYMGVTPKKPIAGVGDPNSPAGIAATMLGMGRFIKTDLERANYWMQNYSEMKHDIDTVVRSMTTARQMNDVEALKKYTEQDKKMYSIHNQINTISQNMSKINRQINIINNDQNMSPQEKYNKIEELHKSQADMARRVVEYGRKLGIM